VTGKIIGSIALGLATTCLAGCLEYLEPGELGQFRFVGDARFDETFRFTPPTSDRLGNVYVLIGAPDVAGVEATVGYEGGGGWFGRCAVHENATRGVHGWVGRARDRAWFWSGDALVEVSGQTSDCRDILDTDPKSAADLAFKAVIPWVKETPSRTTMVAFIQSPSDPVPYWVVVDLDLRRYTTAEEFVPRGGSDVTVLGVGADPDNDSGFVLLRYEIEGAIRVEGRFLADDATVTDIANIDGLQMAAMDEMTGFMQVNNAGFVAGITKAGELVVFNENGGEVRTDLPLTPIGIHKWEGEVYVVGTGSGRPAVAKLGENGGLGSPRVWGASERAAASLRGTLRVQDDRFTPVDTRTWTDPVGAFGPFPFLTPHSPHPYAVDTTLLLIAGPSYMTAGETFTSIAAGPVGISYP
jgi:hypothetical protein